MRDDALGEEPLRRPLARRGLTDAARATAHAGDDSGTDCALKVEDGAVAGGAELAAQGADGAACVGAERMAFPVAAWGKVEAVDDRHCGAAWLCCGLAGVGRASGEQRLPARLDDPADLPIGMSEAQGRYRRQRVENIAHCTQTDNEQAEVGLRVQRTIFAQPDQREGGVQ